MQNLESRPLVLTLFFVALFIAGYVLAYSLHARRRISLSGNPAQLDPWTMQSHLMHISGQRQPLLPQVNSDSVLYWALTLEETSETGEALLDVLVAGYEHVKAEHGAIAADEYRSLMSIVSNASDLMHSRSIRIRNILKDAGTWKAFEIEPTREQSKKLLDGTNDVTVVNCGFANATGLPGRPGYGEVQSSNLSKANPDTGFIDKTPDGKWIKGVGYVEPDMFRVLDEQAELVGGVTDNEARPMPLDAPNTASARPMFLRQGRRASGGAGDRRGA